MILQAVLIDSKYRYFKLSSKTCDIALRMSNVWININQAVKQHWLTADRFDCCFLRVCDFFIAYDWFLFLTLFFPLKKSRMTSDSNLVKFKNFKFSCRARIESKSETNGTNATLANDHHITLRNNKKNEKSCSCWMVGPAQLSSFCAVVDK